MVKKVLITGGLGFIGSHITQRCVAEGYSVRLLSKTDRKIKNIQGIEDKVELVLKDIRDISREDVSGVDYLFHCASTTDNYNINNAPYLDIETNCTGTIAMLEACRRHNSSVRIIYLSTFFVNGNLKELPATPESHCEPLGLYPATKLAGEHFCKIYGKVFGLDTVIARMTNVFGTHEQRNNKKKAAFNNLIELAVQGKDVPIYSNGEFTRDYIYVSDVTEALLTLAEKGERGRVYYVGNGTPIKFKKLMEIVIQEAGSGSLVPIEPPEFHKNVGIVDYYCDNSPLRLLGWKPKVSMQEGIRKVVQEYKNGK
jgi:nucleoside-diphosphate-sugar epimerase